MAKRKNTIKIDPYIIVYGSNRVKFPYEPDSFSYLYQEEGDDECTLTFCTNNPYLADNPYLQEGQKLSVEWGYRSTNEFNTRTVYIFDTKTSYDENGIKMTITCHEKFTMTKLNRSGSSVGSALKPTTKDTQTLVLGFEVLNQMDIEVEKGNKELENLLKSAGIEIKNKTVELNTAGWVDSKTSSALGNQSNQNVGLEHRAGTQVNERATKIEPGMERIYHTPTASTYRLLRQVLDRLPGGPYIVESRDERVTIKTRNFAKPPVKSYTFMGEDGELLSFEPETKNRSKSSSSSKTSATGWNPKTKKSSTSNSNKTGGAALADGKSQNLVIDGLWNFPGPKTFGGIPTLNATVEKIFNDALKQQRANQKPVDKKVPQPYLGPDYFKEAIERDQRQREAREKERQEHNSNLSKRLGGSGELYQPEEEVEGIQFYEPWENEGRRPGSRDGTISAIDNVYVARTRRPIMPKFAGAKVVKKPGTPEKTTLLGTENEKNIKAYAKNKRSNKELENNPASAMVVGNPYIETGQIITFMGVAKKHSGNYYVKKVEHNITHGSGYLTTISEMVRQGPMKSKASVPAKASSVATDKVTLASVKPVGVTLNSTIQKPEQLVVNNQVGPQIQEPGQRLTIQDGVSVVIKASGKKNIIQTIKAKEA